MRHAILSYEAKATDAHFLAKLDANYLSIPEHGQKGLYGRALCYWKQRIERRPGTVFVAMTERMVAAGYLALNNVCNLPVEANSALQVSYLVSPYCRNDNVMDSLLERAGIELVQPKVEVLDLTGTQDVEHLSLYV